MRRRLYLVAVVICLVTTSFAGMTKFSDAAPKQKNCHATKTCTTTTTRPTTTTNATTTTRASTTTLPATTTTAATTTTTAGTCSGVALTGGQTQVAAAPTGTTFCLSGTHNWSLTPRAGQRFIGPAILDGQNSTAHAFNAVAPNVTLEDLTIKNYKNGEQDAPIHIADNDTAKATAHHWYLDDLDVGFNSHSGSGSGDFWYFEGGRYHDNHQTGIGGAMGDDVYLEDVEIDHNGFSDSTYTARGWSCGDEAGGIKWVTDRLRIYNSWVHHNACKGIWADLEAAHSDIDNNIVNGNWDEGIFIEISSSARVFGNTVSQNGLHNYNGPCAGFGWGGGITISNSGRTAAGGNGLVEVSFNKVNNNCNGITGVDISGRDEGPCPCDLANLSVHDNTISGGGPTGAWTDRGTNLANQNIVFTRNTFLNGASYCGITC